MTFPFISFFLKAHFPPHQTRVLFQNKYFLVTDPQIRFLYRVKFHLILQHCNSLPHARFGLLTWQAPVVVLLTEQRDMGEHVDPWSLGIYVEIKEERCVCVWGAFICGPEE